MVEANGDEIRAFVERIEARLSERQDVNDDIREIYAEAVGRGYDKSILREIVKLRKKEAEERAEAEALLSLYLGALGMA